MPFEEMDRFWRRMENNGRKSFRYEELEHVFPLRHSGDFLCHYLEGLSEDLQERDA